MKSIRRNVSKVILCIWLPFVLYGIGAKASALPPDPNNAALLYYQAMLNCSKIDETTNKALNAVLSGAEPDEKARKYLSRNREIIELVEAATRIPECEWGIRYSEGDRAGFPLKQLDDLSRLLCADALVLAADGNYKIALERCLTNRRFAAHIGDDEMTLYAISHHVDRRAQVSIQRILGSMPSDMEILTWIQDQIVAVQGAPQSPAKALRIDFEIALQTLRTSPKILSRLRDRLVEEAKDESLKKRAQDLTDEELVARAGEPYAAFLDSALRVIDSEATHEEKYEAIEKLSRKLHAEFSGDLLANEIISTCADQVLRLYRLRVTDTARFNALRAAIAIYIEKAKTGRLPAKLPDGLPKDPYSGGDFQYERIEEGFTLRSQVKPFYEDRIRQFEFKVRR